MLQCRLAKHHITSQEDDHGLLIHGTGRAVIEVPAVETSTLLTGALSEGSRRYSGGGSGPLSRFVPGLPEEFPSSPSECGLVPIGLDQ